MNEKLDPKLVEHIKGLKMEFGDQPQEQLLVQIPNPTSGPGIYVEHRSLEFTSLCPLNVSQPDMGEISIWFEPKEFLVELKSLKLYLVSFRTVQVFHEAVPVVIRDALLTVLGDVRLSVTGTFNVRGGIGTSVTAVSPLLVQDR